MNPVTWSDLHSWAYRRRVNPSDWEIDAIFGIDEALRASLNEDTK